MVSSNIKVFLRVRPSAKPSKAFQAKQDEGLIAFEMDKHTPEGQVNNTRTNFKFKFDGFLPMNITQEEVFNVVAKPVIEDVLQGINGTIFAYGQTGSGKTFTITGGSERYADRGIIPRTIAYLFEEFQNRKDASYRLYISYLEIYNNDGYDLLCREDSAKKLEDLPKVQLREDEDGNIHLRNLSVNMAQKAEDALNLLFLGDTNRVVAETPMNDASTRSHCMFILWIDSTQTGSDTVRRAKLHLVDLAGSERISKTGVEGNLQKEARYINLSLHYLEQVIVALHERTQGARSHVPYRNSMMTSVLRDSLGGNCKTVMVGTAAVEDRCLDESISTCRFAQRVAAIKNNATINEELDPALLIRRLKKEVAELKDELKLLNSDDGAQDVTEEDKEECKKLLSSYLAQQDLDSPFSCGSIVRFRECFKMLREVYWQNQVEGLSAGGASGGAVGSRQNPTGAQKGAADPLMGSLEANVMELRQQVVQRDQEIGILVGSLSKRSGNAAREAAQDGRVFIKGAPRGAPPGQSGGHPRAEASAPSDSGGRGAPAEVDSASLLLDRNKAFEVFRKSVRRSETLEEGREAMKSLVTEAKTLGERANAARAAINTAKTRVEKARMERAMESCPRDPTAEDGAMPLDSPEVVGLLSQIEEHKGAYKQCTERLKAVKADIDKYKLAADQNKERLQKDFEGWYLSLQASQGSSSGGPTAEAEDLSASRHLSSASSAAPAAPQASGGDSSRSAGAAYPALRPAEGPPASPRAASAGPVSAARATSSTPQAPPATKLTGHQQTDDDIAAYFAAIADLQG